MIRSVVFLDQLRLCMDRITDRDNLCERINLVEADFHLLGTG